MPEIRLIQDALIERAHRFDVPVIMNATLDQAMGEVLDLVLSTADRLVTRRRLESARVADCLCTRYARATEWAALAGARWLGRADEEAAEDAAASAMKAALDELPIDGRDRHRRAVGRGARAGRHVGAGGDRVDLALDPIEGRGVVARGGVGAMAMLAVAPEGALRQLPDMYMRTIAVGPRARGVIDLNRPVAENVQQVAESFGRQPLDITALVLDRPRHHDLIEELRSAGTRIKLIGDGTVTASISAAIRGTNDHLAIGIGGTRQAVLTAAALRCLGGGMQAQLWPTTRTQIEAAREVGIEDIGARVHRGGPRAGRRDRRRDRGDERRPAPRRPLPRRLRAHALARHVHALQLGALRRRDPLLRPRAARGSAPARVAGVAVPRSCDRDSGRLQGYARPEAGIRAAGIRSADSCSANNISRSRE